MSLSSFAQILPFLFVFDVALYHDVPEPLPQARVVEASPDLHERRKQFLVRAFRKIFELENPELRLLDGMSREEADHLLPYGVMLDEDNPCATDVADRQLERFGRVAGYDSFHWAWYPQNKAMRNTGYRMVLITRIKLGDVAGYLTDQEFVTRLAGEFSDEFSYDGYLAERQIALSRTECAGFDLYNIELS